MERHFYHNYEVRYDACDLYGFLTPGGVLCYLQDIAERDASDGDLLDELGNWFVRRTIVEFLASVPVRVTLEADTFAGGISRVTFLRRYELRIAGGEMAGDSRPVPAIKARTLWVYVDSNGRPARIPPKRQEVWFPDGSPPIPNEAPWPPFPDRPAFKTTAPVRFSDLDLISHMNNAAYVRLLDDAAWEALAAVGVLPDSSKDGPLPLHYDIEYLESARPGDELTVDSWFQPIAEQPGQFERYQRVMRQDRMLVRARSRWRWQWLEGANSPAFERLWR
jgi:acyl-CoA thioesterase FadM